MSRDYVIGNAETAPRPLSALLEALAQEARQGSGPLTVAAVAEALHERGIGAVMLLFAVPLALPTGILPGANTVFALPLLALTPRLAMGLHTLWLPRRIMEKKLDREKLAGLIESALPWLRKMEILIRPRLGGVTTGFGSRLSGLCAVIMALVASIPLPLTHTVPGTGLMIMAAGLAMRDGLAVIAGILIGMGWIALLGGALAFFGPEAFDIIRAAIKSVL